MSCFFDSQCSAVRTSVDIGASAKLELVDKFCYLADMLSVDGDADAAVEATCSLYSTSHHYALRCAGLICVTLSLHLYCLVQSRRFVYKIGI